MQKFGIDLFNHNKNINFQTLKDNGVEFAILRAGYTGYGDGVSKAKDTCFEEFYTLCKQFSIGVGAYWFTCANTYQKGVDEANYMYENCLKGKQFDYPIYIDVEDDTGGRKWLRNAGKEKITDGILGFCETLEKKGYYVGIYANLDWFNNWINQDRVKNYDKWLAAWLKYKPNTYLADKMWQFGGEQNQIRSPYISGQCVDQDYCYFDYPKTIKENGLNGYPKQPQPESKDLTYRSWVQDKKWTDWAKLGEWTGSKHESKRLEALQIDPKDNEVYVEAHIEKDGWKDYGKITKDTIIGTQGQSKRLECLKMKICKDGKILKEYNFQLHIEKYGDTCPTRCDGTSTLGSVGQSLRVESFRIFKKD